MRILVLHAPYFRALWRAAGHDVLTWGPHPECDVAAPRGPVSLDDVLRALPRGFAPELILFGDDCLLLRVVGIESAPCPTVMLSIDAHHNAGWHGPMSAAFDAACVAQRDYLPSYRGFGSRAVHWLPCWAPDGLPPPSAAKRHAVSFVGTLDPRLNPERVALMERLCGLLPLHLGTGAWAEVFGASRIVLNQTVKGDLNARVFEAMACGALLLTERTDNGLLELFADGEHLVAYPRGDADAIVAAVERWLGDETGRAAIAARGFAETRARHLESHRAAALLAHATEAPARRPVVAKGGAARGYGMLAEYARRLAELHPQEPFYPAARRAYVFAAAALAADAEVDEVDRRAALGMIALERGRPAEAAEHFTWAATHDGRAEDHLRRIEALLQLGDVRAGRDAVEALVVAYPHYELGDALRMSLGLIPTATTPPTRAG
jgi:hypothetical protein